jgi:CBS domain-containing protein
VEKESSVAEIARLMRNHHVGDVVIVFSRGGRARPVGILPDREIVIELIACDVPLDPVTAAGDIMSYELVTAGENDSILDTLQHMRAKGIQCIPVVGSAGDLVSILAADDLLELFAEELKLLAKIPFREQLIEGVARP